ncbi:hypothetical protein [Neorhodopirellula lusitana]|uniref:hypothetical protein n=1 Tax=Neorhodopirellula lusitana TaxID=445327 RepID=UPI0024B72701|nr:hypothetical protein [Neorhodopirellula lusitana]
MSSETCAGRDIHNHKSLSIRAAVVVPVDQHCHGNVICVPDHLSSNVTSECTHNVHPVK